MNYTGISVRSMRRADILAGVKEWLDSRIVTNQNLTGRLHCAEIVAYKFDTHKDEYGYSKLYLAVKTQRGDIEAALVKWDVTYIGNLYASIFDEYDLARWHRRHLPGKILRALTPTSDATLTQKRRRWAVELEWSSRFEKKDVQFWEKWCVTNDTSPEFFKRFNEDIDFAEGWLANN